MVLFEGFMWLMDLLGSNAVMYMKMHYIIQIPLILLKILKLLIMNMSCRKSWQYRKRKKIILYLTAWTLLVFQCISFWCFFQCMSLRVYKMCLCSVGEWQYLQMHFLHDLCSFISWFSFHLPVLFWALEFMIFIGSLMF